MEQLYKVRQGLPPQPLGASMVFMTDFFQQVYEIIARIPSGMVVTYGQIAAALGDPRQARTVGWALHSAPEWLDIPWHRVVNSSGGISTRHTIGGLNTQRKLLEDEGVVFNKQGRLDLERYGWTGIGDPWSFGKPQGSVRERQDARRTKETTWRRQIVARGGCPGPG